MSEVDARGSIYNEYVVKSISYGTRFVNMGNFNSSLDGRVTWGAVQNRSRTEVRFLGILDMKPKRPAYACSYIRGCDSTKNDNITRAKHSS